MSVEIFSMLDIISNQNHTCVDKQFTNRVMRTATDGIGKKLEIREMKATASPFT